ncbi:MAG: replication protein [Sulfolobaceae archaeon]
MAAKKETRTRNWTCIIYPESAAEDWLEIIKSYYIECVISPLHDKDIDGNGKEKKPHYHVLLMFGSVKSYDQVLEITKKLKATIPQRCHNAKALVRYMLHMDDADKAQYNAEDIVTLNGVDISELLRPSTSERYTLIMQMMNFIKQEKITEFCDLVDYAVENRSGDWCPIIFDSATYVLSSYIKSQRHKFQITGNNQSINKETGEII